jgi:peptide-methionine (S)-S-oxide reductase
VTEIVAAPHFWPAEDYHQRYFAKHPGHGSCHWVRGWVPAEAASNA